MSGTVDAIHPASSTESPSWPLAVGVLLPGTPTPEGDEGDPRLDLSLGAYKLGYFLVDVVDIALSPVHGWQRVESLVARGVVDAVVVGAAAASGDRAAALPPTLDRVVVRMIGF
jgi:hypothetical protein